MSTTLSFSNPLFETYVFYVSILSVKMLFMSVWTMITDIRTSGTSNTKGTDNSLLSQGKCVDVPRVKRAHLNDLENIPLFMIISLLYILSEPPAWLATALLRTFTAARIIHTIVYAVVLVPQPARGSACFIGWLITCYMAIHLITSFIQFL